MSQSIIVPPVHDTSPPPFDDDVNDNDEYLQTEIEPTDVLNNSNDDWKSLDDNNDTDIAQVEDNDQNKQEEIVVQDDNDDWANFASFEPKTEEILQTSAANEENTEDNWADFESSSIVPITSEIVESQEVANNNDDDDDFGEFSEVQAAPPPPPANTLSSEQIESLISTCFSVDSTSTTDDAFLTTELPSFTTYKYPVKQISYLESSLSLWKILSNLSNDPVGIQFQWRKSNTEKLFHQALGVNERFRPKNVPLTPEILQPEKLKSTDSLANESENVNNENKTSLDTLRPQFDWKKSGLQNPLADNDSSSLSSNMSKNEEIGFDANKTLDLDFYVPTTTTTTKSANDSEQLTNSSTTESPIIPSQYSSIPIKTTELSPNSTTTLNDDAKRIIDSLPNFSFMSAKALMFPVRFNANNNEDSTSLF